MMTTLNASRMTKAAIVAIALAVAASGCSSGGGGPVAVEVAGADPNCPLEGGQEYPADARPSSTAEITVISPKQGEVVAGPDVEVEIRIDGACILGYDGVKEIRPDTGHVHVSLDQRTLSLLAGTTYVIEDVEPGSHIIEVGFYAADHVNFTPPVNKKVSFKVDG